MYALNKIWKKPRFCWFLWSNRGVYFTRWQLWHRRCFGYLAVNFGSSLLFSTPQGWTQPCLPVWNFSPVRNTILERVTKRHQSNARLHDKIFNPCRAEFNPSSGSRVEISTRKLNSALGWKFCHVIVSTIVNIMRGFGRPANFQSNTWPINT
jgi:hypothetical protein